MGGHDNEQTLVRFPVSGLTLYTLIVIADMRWRLRTGSAVLRPIHLFEG
ncbi:hypothetical protein SBI_03891 [Streptomyces bingchenggensis BCW-1]|uniref:Uncharacterized protein n=1 Tax=Streptomyces bingchenggensis (strain BCW-1) TaxID=749414 RepID=D7CHF5_STRBB|nr:hypothetical protein SBI_03891 [Streptomyces bingchenggensis BCW-1]